MYMYAVLLCLVVCLTLHASFFLLHLSDVYTSAHVLVSCFLQTCKDMFDQIDGNSDGNLTFSVEVWYSSCDCRVIVM